jgi:hypothetical protein
VTPVARWHVPAPLRNDVTFSGIVKWNQDLESNSGSGVNRSTLMIIIKLSRLREALVSSVSLEPFANRGKGTGTGGHFKQVT